jgi:hypothetical protein
MTILLPPLGVDKYVHEDLEEEDEADAILYGDR